MTDTALNPWDRRPNEPTGAYAAFVVYRDLGPGVRSIRKVATVRGKKSHSAERDWARDFDWIERVEAWDDARERERRDADAQARADMANRHATVGALMIAKAVQRLNAIDAATLRVADAIALIKVGATLERLSRGDVTGRFEHTGAVRLEAATILDALRSNPELTTFLDSLGDVLDLDA